ncbi:heterokaryon incompatibility protein-domain-containing protein [Paraphoma chrysanthemicola]|nr:heterokaryon incompatibility protein-domain-containing protein [Paraphoma chrysanthemicola]
MANAKFLYSPLENKPHVFRLLRLVLSSGELIRCELFNTTVPEYENRYIAGSYVWGLLQLEEHIQVNGQLFSIRQNLYSFLSACRAEAPLLLWLDAICIDQSSIEERNHQVRMMDVIYKNAYATYSWLGSATADTDWLFSNLPKIPYRLDMLDGSDMEQLYPDNTFFKASDILLALAGREYWTRIWIVQEFILAQKLYLLCGSMKLAWSRIEKHLEDLAFRHGAKTSQAQSARLSELFVSRITTLRQ